VTIHEGDIDGKPHTQGVHRSGAREQHGALELGAAEKSLPALEERAGYDQCGQHIPVAQQPTRLVVPCSVDPVRFRHTTSAAKNSACLPPNTPDTRFRCAEPAVPLHGPAPPLHGRRFLAGSEPTDALQSPTVSKRTVKRKLRAKKKANHGKRPNAGKG